MSGSARQVFLRKDVRRCMTTLEYEYIGVVPYRELKIVDALGFENVEKRSYAIKP